MKFKTCPRSGLKNRRIYRSGMYAPAPAYRCPTYDTAYMKILKYVSDHPECEMRDCLQNVFSTFKNFDIFKTLVNFGFIDKTDLNTRRHVKFVITEHGQRMLDEAQWTKPAHELIKFAKSVKAENAEVLSFQLTLAGKSYMAEQSFLQDVECIMKKHTYMKKRIYKAMPFFDDFRQNAV